MARITLEIINYNMHQSMSKKEKPELNACPQRDNGPFVESHFSDGISEKNFLLWHGETEKLLTPLVNKIELHQNLFDLVVTSPPYNIDKEYEGGMSLEKYIEWQDHVINDLIYPLMKPGSSLCWQVGFTKSKKNSYQDIPLDCALWPIFQKNFQLRNRIVWTFKHSPGNPKNRLSRNYEVVLWFGRKCDKEWVFNLDDIRVDQLYPGKTHSMNHPNKELRGKISGNSKGKNPGDVIDNIPQVKAQHSEKQMKEVDGKKMPIHPCQYPVGLIEKLVLALTNREDLVFDPFMGVGSAGVAAALHERRFWGSEIDNNYIQNAKLRIREAMYNPSDVKYRPHDAKIKGPEDHPMGKKPKEWEKNDEDKK